MIVRNVSDIQTIRTRTSLYRKAFFCHMYWETGTHYQVKYKALLLCLPSNHNLKVTSKNVLNIFIKAKENGKYSMLGSERNVALSINTYSGKICQPHLIVKVDFQRAIITSFFECHLYNDIRVRLFDTISYLCTITLYTLLNGDQNISNDNNSQIFQAVHIYIYTWSWYTTADHTWRTTFCINKR